MANILIGRPGKPLYSREPPSYLSDSILLIEDDHDSMSRAFELDLLDNVEEYYQPRSRSRARGVREKVW